MSAIDAFDADHDIEVTSLSTASKSAYAGQERRRPGRPEEVSPHLIPLMRGQPEPLSFAEDATGVPMMGLVFGVAFSVPLWGVIGLVAWTFFG